MKRRSLVAVLAAGSLVLAACGDDDDAADEPSEDTTADTEAEEEPAEETTETTMAEEDMDDMEEEPTETTMAEDDMDESTETTMAEGDDMETPEGWPESIVLTLTPSQEAGGLVETAEPLAVALEEALGIDVEAIVPSDYAGVIVALQSGQAQIAGGLGPAQMVQAADTAGADLILQAVRFGDSQYVTQWFTNDPDTYCATDVVQITDEEDGTIMSFCNGVDEAEGPSDGPIGSDQLPNVAGQTISFVDQGSTSGYLIPSLALIEAGVDPLDDITSLFAGGHDSSVQAVYDGDAAVGVSFNDARGQLVETVPDVGEKVVVFGWSAPIPNDGFAVAGDLPDDLKTAITDALVAYSSSEDGAVVMDELYEIDGLVPVPEGSYDIIRDLETELSDLLG
ncbi:phosphonate transport system substrate-binding protein [Ilumatobacter fluminis]|uniref:Phosphonate transport system substrate-binding protein n=1 Tax=Ilumatobacter fluminis TaxID=467091 RepID=A0A4R7HX09_9ACTN|nr:phosphate/phosphite/phosphonate ABC transporter substrate-binding protein [Ilumatobacter fluminis]TDT15677.1 phosphonate transport system substrate-binding protein [Ilumatobacter fluminis]